MIGSQFILPLATKLIVDLFAGGGGASTGIEQAVGRHVDVAINHDPKALAMHQANHPQTLHLPTNVWEIEPRSIVARFGGRAVGALWASPDCRHFSPAKGGAPVSDRVRSLAWVVIKWAAQVEPDVIFLENIPEFRNWGPVVAGRPCAARRGKTFRRFVQQLSRTGPGYDVEIRELVAADYDTPTTRKRLFMVAKKKGTGAIVWPKPTNGQGLLPYRTAAECIDWSIPCPSIFERVRPLAPATLRRIAHGVWRYVVTAQKPFIVPVTHPRDARVHSIDDPFRTVTGANRGELALAAPLIARIGQTGHSEKRARRADAGLSTITTKAEHLLVSPLIVSNMTNNVPRPASEPVSTILSGNHKFAAAAFLAKHYGGNEGPGIPADGPAGTITTQDHHHLVAAHLVKHFGGVPQPGRTAQPVTAPAPTVLATGGKQGLVTSHLAKLRGTSNSAASNEPLATISAGGWHHAEVRALLLAYYGTDQAPQLGNPLPTATTRDRFALVTVDGQDYVIADIGMRMLQPRELFRAQGFPDSYIIEWGIQPSTGRRITLTKGDQVRMCGNSVCPKLARAIVASNFSDFSDQRLAA